MSDDSFAPDHLEGVEYITKSRSDDLVQAAVAAKLREAAEVVRCSDFRHEAHDSILALIPADAQSALDRVVAVALREAAAEIEAMRGPIDVPRTDKSVVFDEAADRCIEIVLNYITSDAQAALRRVVAAERERGFWAGRSCGGSKAEIDAALAAIREGGE